MLLFSRQDVSSFTTRLCSYAATTLCMLSVSQECLRTGFKVWNGTEQKSILKRALALYIICKHSVYECDSTSMSNGDRDKARLANTLGNEKEWLQLSPVVKMLTPDWITHMTLVYSLGTTACIEKQLAWLRCFVLRKSNISF